MKKNFLKNAGVLLAVSICVALISANAGAAETCGGCEKVKAVTDKVRTVPLTDDQKIDELIDAASKAINSLPKTKGHLTPAQVREMVALLNQVTKVDKNHFVIEEVLEVIKANKAEFNKAVQALPAEDAKRVSLYVAAVIDEQINGNDAPMTGKK